MQNTPRSERLHIGLFGKCNSGKSSLVNALTGQRAALVSEVAGTTTDPVNKSMELPGAGAVTFIDTAGFDDRGVLGAERLSGTVDAAERTDIAVVVFTGADCETETGWVRRFRDRGIPVIAVLNKSDLLDDPAGTADAIERNAGIRPLPVSCADGTGIDALRQSIARAAGDAGADVSITGDLVRRGDTVMLVMPQDSQAPKGRLILPQVQTIRELLDKGCTIICTTPDGMAHSLAALTAPPSLIITDSQAFGPISRLTPAESRLTSFSVLFARYKGDIERFAEGAAAIDSLTENSRVLIAEACTHAPAGEDIGTVKIPALLRKKTGPGLRIDTVSGNDFPTDLSGYDLVIHCGACMFNRRHVLSRLEQAARQGVPMTNYGITIAHLTGIMRRIVYPKGE